VNAEGLLRVGCVAEVEASATGGDCMCGGGWEVAGAACVSEGVLIEGGAWDEIDGKVVGG